MELQREGQSCKEGCPRGAGWQEISGGHRCPSLWSATGQTFSPEEPTEPWKAFFSPSVHSLLPFSPSNPSDPPVWSCSQTSHKLSPTDELAEVLCSPYHPWNACASLRRDMRVRLGPGSGWVLAQAWSRDTGDSLGPSLDTELASGWSLSAHWRLNRGALVESSFVSSTWISWDCNCS